MYFTCTLNISFFYFTLTIWTVLSTYILHVQYLWKEDVAIGNLKNSDKYMWRIRFTARAVLLFCTCTCLLFTNSLNSFLMYYVYFRSLVLLVEKYNLLQAWLNFGQTCDIFYFESNAASEATFKSKVGEIICITHAWLNAWIEVEDIDSQKSLNHFP